LQKCKQNKKMKFAKKKRQKAKTKTRTGLRKWVNNLPTVVVETLFSH